MGRTAFVTGATGFVGSALVRRLLAAGFDVRALVRPGTDLTNIKGLTVELIKGDVRDPGSFWSAMAGCSAVFHVAADYRLWVRRPREMYKTNVDGTINVLRAAAAAGVHRIVYTSSVATLGLAENDQPVDENTPSCLDDMIGHYKRSKFLAETEVRRLHRVEGLPVVIVNPSTPFGPCDRKPTPTGRIVVEAARGRMPAFVDTGLNAVHVDDVAEGHLLALERGRIGERYILGGDNLTLRDILIEVAEIAGGRPPFVRLSPGLVLPLAVIAEAWAFLAGGREPLLTVNGVRLARKRMFFSCEKAKRELGYRWRPATEGLRDAVAWYRERKMLPLRSPSRLGGVGIQ